MTKHYIIQRPNLQSPIEIFDTVMNKYIPIGEDSNFKRLVCFLLNKHSEELSNINDGEFEDITNETNKKTITKRKSKTV